MSKCRACKGKGEIIQQRVFKNGSISLAMKRCKKCKGKKTSEEHFDPLGDLVRILAGEAPNG